jgi:hypothetical protein
MVRREQLPITTDNSQRSEGWRAEIIHPEGHGL